MEASRDGAFAARDRAAAENFARAARAAGTERIIYLGGLIPEGGPVSAHLASRLEVEQTLFAAAPSSVALRASIVIGAASRPFRFLVRLVERLPVLPMPAWRDRRTTPIDERDMIELLARTATSDAVAGQTLDVGGPDEVSYMELIEHIRDHLLLGRPTIRLGRMSATPIASRIASVVASEEYELIGPLMESLATDLLAGEHRAAELLGVRLHSLDAAIEHALAEWEATEPLAAR
jgi:nucleoside-diphosphate-sugar epimerase